MTKARDIASAIPAPSTVSSAELGYLDGVTSAIQTQIDAKQASSTAVTLTGTQTLTNKTLTNPVIASVINNTLTSTTGDIIYASGANTPARLGIGSTSQVLTVASGIPSWATPAGGGADWTLLNSGGTSLSGSQTVTISSISGKDKIMLLVKDVSTVNTGVGLGVRINGDTASNYYNYGLNIEIHAVYQTNLVNPEYSNLTYIRFCGMSNNASSIADGAVTLTGCNSSGVKQFSLTSGVSSGQSTNHSSYVTQGYYDSSSTVSSISLYSNSGNFDAGTIYVYASA